MPFNPNDDGKTHINAYSKGKTELGRKLSNFWPVEMDLVCADEITRRFASIEAYWYHTAALLNGFTANQIEHLRMLSGWQAKQAGRSLNIPDWERSERFKHLIRNALDVKLAVMQLEDEVRRTSIPIVHYYAYGNPPKVHHDSRGDWVFQHVDRIRGTVRTGVRVLNKHIHAPTPGCVNIMRPTRWGNPFSHMQGTVAQWHVDTREEAVARYATWVIQQPELMASLHLLRDHDLMCCCEPEACHGRILKHLAALPLPTEIPIPGHKPAYLWQDAFPKTDMLPWDDISWQHAPAFLGKHWTQMFGTYHGKNYGRYPSGFMSVHLRMRQLAAVAGIVQPWTTGFAGKFMPGSFVKRHCDPKDNLGYTLIFVQLTGTPPVTVVAGVDPITVQHNCMLALPCTIDDKQGPPHEVSPMLNGMRYTLILNWIK